MKTDHRTNILADFEDFGILTREKLMANRKRYGLHFDRRIRELDLDHDIEREWADTSDEGHYIKAWKYIGPWVTGQLDLEIA